MTCVSQGYFILIDLQDVPYLDSLILSNTSLYKFFRVFWLPALACFLLLIGKVDLFF